MPVVRLHSYYRSSCSYRVRIALALKNIQYEYVGVNLIKEGGQQHAPDYQEKNAMAQVPLFEIEHGPGQVVQLTQSVAILEYLEERFPDPPLMPSDSLARARVRKCVEIVNSGIQPMQNLATMNEVKRLGGDASAFARNANEKGLAALEREAQAYGAGFVIGEELSLADVCLVPQMYSARRLGVEMGAFPRLSEIDARLATLPAFLAAHPDRQPDTPT